MWSSCFSASVVLVHLALFGQLIRVGSNPNDPPDTAPSSLALSFTQEPPSKVEFSNNTGKTIECEAATSKPSGPKPTVAWTFVDGTPVENVRGLRQVNPTDGSLTFAPFASESFRQDVHAAVYRCTASNMDGAIASRDVRVKAMMDVDYDSSVYDVFAIRGNTAVIKCHVPPFLQDVVSVVAYIKDDSLKIGSTPDKDTKFTLSSQGTLYIRDVGSSDSGSSYKCQTYHHLTGKMKISSGSGRLFVTDPHGNIPPRIVDSLNAVQARVGEHILVPCVVHGHPLPKATQVTELQTRTQPLNLIPMHCTSRWTTKPKLTMDERFKQNPHGLYVEGVQLSDAAKYICQINGTVGSDAAETLLTVAAPLTVSIQPIKQVVDIGNPLSLSCSVTASPVTSIWWLKDGHEVDPHKFLPNDKRQLRVESMTVEDKGMYQCFARLGDEVAQSTAQVLVGDFPPVLSQTFTEVTVQPGQSVSLTCMAHGSPAPDMKWTLDTMEVITSENVLIESKSSTRGQMVSTLNIKSSTLEDGGVYACTANNTPGSSSHAARLNVHGPLTVRKIAELNFVAGSNIQLNCPIHGYPIDEVLWQKEDSSGQLASIIVGKMANDTLLIRNVQRAEDSGTYLCTASNRNGQKAKAEVKVKVKVLPKITPFEFQEELLREGMRARIQCAVSEGDPPLDIKWTKDGQPMIANNHLGITVQNVDEYSSILAIRAIDPKHNGNYTCVASNGAGSVGYSATLFVNALPKIIPFAFQDDQNFKGMRAHIICAVSQGDLPLTFHWLKDGHELDGQQLGANVGSYDVHSSSMSIDSVSSKHSGNYTCVATNEAGWSRFTAQLVVQVGPKIDGLSLRDKRVQEGINVGITCVLVEGDPPIVFAWTKDGQPASSLSGVHVVTPNQFTSLLTISGTALAHGGNYSCAATNAVASAVSTAKLSVTVPPKIVPFTFQDDQLVEGMFLRVSCVVSRGDLPLSIDWTKDDETISPTTGIAIRQTDEYSSVLSIDSISRNHSGNYRCRASNAAATATYSASLVVHVPPKWVTKSEDAINATVGSRIKLHCRATGHPEPQVVWKKGRDTYLVSPKETLHGNNAMTIFKNGTVVIAKVETVDGGFYFCEVSNGIGKGLTAVTQVSIRAPPKIKSKTDPLTVKQGGTAKMQCVFDGDSPLNVTWTVNGKAIPGNQPLNTSYRTQQFNADSNLLTTELNIARTTADQVYTCSAQNPFGAAEASIPITVLRRPNPPNDVRVNDLGNKTVEVLWTPSQGSVPVLRYVVEYHSSNEKRESRTVSGTDNRLSLMDLQPSSSYKFVVYAENDVGRSEMGKSVDWSLAGETPGSAPQTIQVQAQNGKSLRIAWQPPPPNSWNGNIRGYYVGYRQTDTLEPFAYKLLEIPEGYEKGLSYTLSELQEFTRYSIVLQAFNDQGKGPLSPEVLVMTSEGVPNKAPLAVQCSPSSSQSIDVSWQPPPQTSVNGILRGYRIIYWTSQTWYGETTLGIANTTTSNKVVLRGLFKYSNYTIQVLAYTLVGDGVASKPIHCLTMEDLPNAPRAVKTLPSTVSSLLVKWAPPAFSTGIILQYTIYEEEMSPIAKDETRHIVKGNSTAYEVRNLKRNVHYRFRVSATTVVGEGPSTPSETASLVRTKVPAQCATFDDIFKQKVNKPLVLSCPAVGLPPPTRSWLFRGQAVVSSDRVSIQPDGSLQITALQVGDAGNYTCRVINDFGQDEVTFTVIVKVPPSTPSLVTSAASATTIDLYWKQASSGHGQILGYVIHYKQEFGSWQSVELQPYMNSFQLNNLQCGTTYQMHLTATNEVGAGQQSEVVTVSTHGGVPTEPPLEKLVEESTDTAVIHLDSWAANGCPILYFVVEHKRKASRGWSLVSNDLKTDKPDLILRDLEPGTRYSLRMTAHTTAGSTVAEYDFATMAGTVNDGDATVVADDVLAMLNAKVLVPIGACFLAIVLCLAATCLWVTRKRQPRTTTKKGRQSDGARGRHSQLGAEPRTSLARHDSDDEISPYAMVKLSDFQKDVMPVASNKHHPGHNYNPTAPPMSETYSPHRQGMMMPAPEHPRRYPILGRPVYAMPKKEKLRHLRETGNGDDQEFPPPPLPQNPANDETTFVFPPPPDERDGDYDPPPPQLDWLPIFKPQDK